MRRRVGDCLTRSPSTTTVTRRSVSGQRIYQTAFEGRGLLGEALRRGRNDKQQRKNHSHRNTFSHVRGAEQKIAITAHLRASRYGGQARADLGRGSHTFNE